MYINKEKMKWLPASLSTRMNVVMPKDKYFFFNAVYKKLEEHYILWSFIANENEFENAPSKADLKQVVIRKIDKWHPAFKELVTYSEEESLLWLPLKTMQPVAPWQSGR